MSLSSEKKHNGYMPQGATLVTGGLGFIFSHYVENHLAYWPHSRVVVFDKEDYVANRKNLEDALRKYGPQRLKIIKGDVRNVEYLQYILYSEMIDTVVHAAAVSHVDHSFNAPIQHTLNNCVGSQSVFEACRLHNKRLDTCHKIRRIIMVSSDEVIGDQEDRNDEQTTVLSPTNPYSASKAAAEMITSSYIKSYKLPIIVTRGNNVYGPRQYPEKVVPKFCLLLQKDRDLPIHGSGHQTRSMMYVTDAAEAYRTIVEHGNIGEVYNIESGYEHSVIDIAKALMTIKGIEQKEQEKRLSHVRDREYNDSNYRVNGDKLKTLGFMCKVHFDDGILKTYEWYQRNASKFWQAEQIETAITPHPIVTGFGM